jgi:carbonic anhydrase
MSRTLEAVLNANAAYAADFDKGDLPMPPGRHFAILTCMDARLDPAKYAGLAEGSYVDWLTIKDTAQSVVEAVQRIRRHPFVPGEIPIYGSIYVDVVMRQLDPDADE